jgi:ubiquinone/menaquinone biosynthesis C-methylase UbiE
VSEGLKDRVRTYWQAEPCGTSTSTAEPGTAEFYAEVERRRYELEPFIRGFAAFERRRGERVLEVGVGLGTDFVQFARAGAELTGIDLTDSAVAAVRERLALEGLDADLRVADAESLPFADGEFDLVYSWGVLHHTPDTERALAEVRRVLRPGGEAKVMLYSRRSWVALGVWLRYGLLRGAPQKTPTELLATWMESPGTKAYTQRELERLFAAFSDVRYERFVTPYDRRVGGPLASRLPSRFGWFVGITATR